MNYIFNRLFLNRLFRFDEHMHISLNFFSCFVLFNFLIGKSPASAVTKYKILECFQDRISLFYLPKICSMCFRIYVHGEKFCVKWKVYLGRYEYLASSCRYIIPKLCSSERAGKTHNPSVEYPPDGNKKEICLMSFGYQYCEFSQSQSALFQI